MEGRQRDRDGAHHLLGVGVLALRPLADERGQGDHREDADDQDDDEQLHHA